MSVYIGVDLGGTKTLVASADFKGKILKRCTEQTPEDPRLGMELIKKMIKKVSDSQKIEVIGCSCGGPLDWKNGVITHPVHMPKWRNIHFKKLMEREFLCPVMIDVDTNIGALGEMMFGSAKKYRNFIYITISTGFGAGIIINKQLYRGVNGEHPELGHQEINWVVNHNIGDIKCRCGSTNCLEGIISGSGIENLYNKKAGDLEDEEWSEVGKNLGKGLRNITTMYAPEAIILSGGVSTKAGHKILSIAKEYVKKHVKLVKHPDIKITELGYESCLMGCIAAAIMYEKV